MKKSISRFLIYVLTSIYVVSCSSFPKTVSFRGLQSGGNGYRRAVRSLDGKSFFSDYIDEGLAYDDEVGCSSIQNYFYNDGTYYDYEQLDELVEQTISMAQNLDSEAELFIPDELDVFSEDVVVTSFDGFQNICSGDFEEETRKTRIYYWGYIDNKLSEYEYDAIISHDTNILNIFVPGIGGDSTHWTNNGEESNHGSDNCTIYLREDSLPYLVKEYYSSSAYVIRPEFSEKTKRYENKCASIGDKNKDCTLTFLNIDDAALKNGSVLLYEDLYHSTSKTEDYYKCFKEYMEYLSELYPEVRFNLFGHSRGGDINLMYATEFPDMVNMIFSLGTPYYCPTLAEISTFVNGLPDWGVFNSIKSFLNGCGLGHLEAYESLADDGAMRSMRDNWNNLTDKADLYALGYGFGFNFSICFEIFGLTFRIDIPISIPWDVLVSANNAMAAPESYVKFNILGYEFEFYAALVHEDAVDVAKRIFINIDMDDILDNVFESKKYLSSPGAPAVPHYMETLYPKTIEEVMRRLVQ